MWFLFPSSGHHSLCFMRFSGVFGVFFWNSWPAKLLKIVHINLTGKPGIPHWLVVSTHLKHIRQIGSFPQVGMKIKNIWNHHPDHESTNESTNESIRKLVTILRPKKNEISEGFFPTPGNEGFVPLKLGTSSKGKVHLPSMHASGDKQQFEDISPIKNLWCFFCQPS